MIDYGMFELAAPAFTGVSWTTRALDFIGIPAIKEGSWWTPSSHPSERLCLSLVRHPCQWLWAVYTSIQKKDKGLPPGVHEDFRRADATQDFEHFVRSYLQHAAGAVTRTFQQYRSDVVLRFEDAPWNLVEFLEPHGIPEPVRRLVTEVPRVAVSRYSLRPELYCDVTEAEEETVDRYEYW